MGLRVSVCGAVEASGLPRLAKIPPFATFSPYTPVRHFQELGGLTKPLCARMCHRCAESWGRGFHMLEYRAVASPWRPQLKFQDLFVAQVCITVESIFCS